MFDKDKIIEFSYENHKSILLWLILVLQVVCILKIANISNYYHNIELKMSNFETILGIATSSDNTQPVLQNGLLKPVETKKTLLPIKPSTAVDIAYIQTGYTPMDNYYPVGADIIYASSEDIFKTAEAYKLQLLNSGWQIIHIKNGSLGQKNFIESLKASNGQSEISVAFQSTLENYSKKAGSFIKIVIDR